MMTLVDGRRFRELFVELLGWSNPDHPPISLEVGGETYVLKQIAGYKGMRLWECDGRPDRKTQRAIDLLAQSYSQERLIIFADSQQQDWRWPRSRGMSNVNAKLLVHNHVAGEPNPSLEMKLARIHLDFDTNMTLIELLGRMREAFDEESEKASVLAARLMGTLYAKLADSGVSSDASAHFLARVLFLMFGDDTELWTGNLFTRFLENSSDGDLSERFDRLFLALDTSVPRRQPMDVDIAAFPYVNGDLFSGSVDVTGIGAGMREALLEASEFDWGLISPAIFGSMFQVVKSKEDRAELGEHYTTEENVKKAISPLFLDDLWARLYSSWDDKGQLTRLHGRLAGMRFVDPACGCGNFLIVAYRELRALELELLKRRRNLDVLDGKGRDDRSQLSFDATAELNIKLDQFYGIEILPWPAKIAQTALLLVDHQANMLLDQEFGQPPDRLPIQVSPTIVERNALQVDWSFIAKDAAEVYVFGNPPFVGQKEKTPRQTEDMRSVWGTSYNGYMDYVTAWLRKSTRAIPNASIAFVATSSVCQGAPVHSTWTPLLEEGWELTFAHRPFNWTTETREKAGVHVVVLGLRREVSDRTKRRLFDYDPSGSGAPHEVEVTRINPYLLDAPNTLVAAARKPVSGELPFMREGSKLWDFGHLVVKPDDRPALEADAIATKFLRPLLTNSTMLKGQKRWVLWLDSSSVVEREASKLLRERLRAVTRDRLSSADAEANKKADVPHLFTNNRQPKDRYLAVPKVTGHSRDYLPVAYATPDVVANNTLFTAVDPDGVVFAVVSSRMFTTWQRLAGGHTRADSNFSNTLVWNTFPMPEMSGLQRSAVIDAGRSVLNARDRYNGWTLEQLYDAESMPAELKSAHFALDRAVMGCFSSITGRTVTTEAERQLLLLELYAEKTHN